MSIKTWKQRITTPLTNQQNLFASMQAEINELRAALAMDEMAFGNNQFVLKEEQTPNESLHAALQERDAEIDRVTAERDMLALDLHTETAAVIALHAEIDRVTAERDALKADAERYQWLTTTGGGIGMRLAEVEKEWNGCDGIDGFNAALERCRAKRMKGKS